jgi:hypothetical protein
MAIDLSKWTPTPVKITVCNLLWQVKADLWAKEVQTSPTYSYQWMADQMGHLAIGLLFTLVGVWVLPATWPGVLIGAGIALVFAVVKELRDWIAEGGKIKAPRFNAGQNQSDIRNNALIASYYMVGGAVLGLAALSGWAAWISIPIAVVLIVAPAAYWLRQKLRFQQAALPYLYRLPEFEPPEGCLDDPTCTEAVNELVKGSAERPRCFVIAGPLNSGKTSLAVGIGTEAAFHGRKVRYVTLSKLRQLAETVDGAEPASPRNMKWWPIRESELLIVDDVAGLYATASRPGIETTLQQLGNDFLYGIGLRDTVWCLEAAVLDEINDAIAALQAAMGWQDPEPERLILQRIDAPAQPGASQEAGHAN